MDLGGWRIGIALFVVGACGTSDAERICERASACGLLHEDGLAVCVENIDASTAGAFVDSCAECVAAATCDEIGADACANQCDFFEADFKGCGLPATRSLLLLTTAEREQLCIWALDRIGGPGASETCVYQPPTPTVVAMNDSVDQCVAELAMTMCASTVAVVEACYEAADSPCGLFQEPACMELRGCVGD